MGVPLKPHALKGQGLRIVEMIDKQGMSFEQVAALYGASSMGIRYRYKKEKAASTPSTSEAANHPGSDDVCDASLPDPATPSATAQPA